MWDCDNQGVSITAFIPCPPSLRRPSAKRRSDGTIARIESSVRRNGRIDRVEYYEGNALVRAEEDTDGDGKIDKWETYDSTRLTTVSFDTTHSGRPDRRLVYSADGTVRVEVVPHR